ncbi:probable pseudouridine-5'-phosphatase [Drosophila miranda]|uniref:probable pseudouridine-5'-phosphatase n=1 Tax=Drosophila miranda TaxID=7229 RepID=UPI0007E601DE|nr:probable pseudouridine-5'-phosphatase [Drosophila miranda]XP_017155197.1 probable pseudouridine-5'-phosphatase [Drosophila miranda]XP_017155199.1 probable pseudouridine-5'-phosphatase [Drosophila miranda]XP_017155200.1 probable pseudouridine-5'-phosphatase [Drosophila miranda]XP_033249491.1 probable pseudouridine-5'-phosphatase [Drosophila miranda]XP_033249492.1 probable pseudouridine-5'-phosphatase [Drosophila miranda]
MSELVSSSRHCCFRPVTHCIFELDGLLLDSERLNTRAVQQILDPFGHIYGFDLKLRCMGKPSPESADMIIDSYGLPLSRTQFQRLHRLHSRNHLGSVGLMPGAERLLRHLHASHVPMALETSGSRESYDLKVRPHAQLFEVFQHAVVGGSDSEVKRCKPSPDIFLTAAARFKDPPEPENCLVLESSLLGMEAALAAGMQVVLVPDPLLSIRLSAPATLRLRSLEAFRPQYFGLPPF